MESFSSILLGILAIHWTVMRVTTALPTQIRLAAIFDEDQDKKHELAFRYAIERVNKDPKVLPGKRLVPEIVKVPPGNSFHAEKETCNVLPKGVAAIFGPQSEASADHIRSIADSVEIPFIDTRWNFKSPSLRHLGPTLEEYTINLHPDVETLGQAYVDLISRYGWDTATVLYEDNNSMARLKKIFDKTSETTRGKGFRLITKELKWTEENGYRDVLRELYVSKATNIILDCGKRSIGEVLKQCQQVGLVSEEYFYLLTSLDAHTVDMEDFKFGGTNFTAFRLVDTGKPEVQNVIANMVQGEMNRGRVINFQDGNLDTDTALIYDAILSFSLALHELSRIQDIQLMPLDCLGDTSWNHGSSITNYMKLGEFTGLSDKILFDAQGLRTNFYLDVLELQKTGLENIGTWNHEQGLNLTRIVEVTESQNPNNIMANKTFVVTLLKAPPYTMLKEETQRLEGNDRFEGFAVDLMNAISQLLHFNITYKVVDDGRHGSMDLHGNWDGAMHEVIKGTEEDGADFAVADLSITSVRATAVDFSMPWMNLGISIIYIKPREAPPSMLSFLSPFTVEVWIYTALGFMIVSLLLFILARFSPYEWDNPYPCIEEPEELENQFSMANSFWCTIGSLMQQGSDIAPTALSTRLLIGMWFFFALIMIASYTANLAAFLTVETLEKPIESADDLAAQTKIKYGVLRGGSTESFFRNAVMEPFITMWKFMELHESEVMVSSNEEGLQKVLESDGGYAYLMESSSIMYIVERNCELVQVGGNLDNKGYGIPMRKGSPYKSLIDSAILELQEESVLFKLKTKWWKQKRGGGACQGGGSGEGSVAELGLPNVAGVFIVTVAGCFVATILAFIEFLVGAKNQSEELGTPWLYEIKEELKFAFKCHGRTKILRQRFSNESSSESSSSHMKNSSSSSSTSSSSSSSSSSSKQAPDSSHKDSSLSLANEPPYPKSELSRRSSRSSIGGSSIHSHFGRPGKSGHKTHTSHYERATPAGHAPHSRYLHP